MTSGWVNEFFSSLFFPIFKGEGGGSSGGPGRKRRRSFLWKQEENEEEGGRRRSRGQNPEMHHQDFLAKKNLRKFFFLELTPFRRKGETQTWTKAPNNGISQSAAAVTNTKIFR